MSLRAAAAWTSRWVSTPPVIVAGMPLLGSWWRAGAGLRRFSEAGCSSAPARLRQCPQYRPDRRPVGGAGGHPRCHALGGCGHFRSPPVDTEALGSHIRPTGRTEWVSGPGRGIASRQPLKSSASAGIRRVRPGPGNHPELLVSLTDRVVNAAFPSSSPAPCDTLVICPLGSLRPGSNGTPVP